MDAKEVRITRQLCHGFAYDRYVTDGAGRRWLFTDKMLNVPCRRGAPRLARVVVDLTGETATVTATYVRVPASSPPDLDARRVMAVVGRMFKKPIEEAA